MISPNIAAITGAAVIGRAIVTTVCTTIYPPLIPSAIAISAVIPRPILAAMHTIICSLMCTAISSDGASTLTVTTLLRGLLASAGLPIGSSFTSIARKISIYSTITAAHRPALLSRFSTVTFSHDLCAAAVVAVFSTPLTAISPIGGSVPAIAAPVCLSIAPVSAAIGPPLTASVALQSGAAFKICNN
jgi:hypothetical protein